MDTHHRALDHLMPNATDPHGESEVSAGHQGRQIRGSTKKRPHDLDELMSTTVEQARRIC